MPLRASSETEVTDYWNRIAMHVRGACALVARDARPVLVKFDGERDNGEIYTVVRYAVTDDEAIFIRNGSRADEATHRTDSDDLEEALLRVLPAGESGTMATADDIAGTLRMFDSLARRGFVICVYITRNSDDVEFDVYLTAGVESSGHARKVGDVLSDVAAEVLRQCGEA